MSLVVLQDRITHFICFLGP